MKKLSLVLPLLALAFLSSNVCSAGDDAPTVVVDETFTNVETENIENLPVVLTNPTEENVQKLQEKLKQNGPMILQVRTVSGWNTFLGFVCGVFKICGFVDAFKGVINGSDKTFFSGIFTILGAEFAYEILKDNDNKHYVYLDLAKPVI